jgi:hypothetical protein
MKPIYVPMNGETGCYVGPNGKLQTRRIKALLIHAFPNALEIDFHPNHYECSAMIKFAEDNIVYFSTSDYRFFPQSFLVRTAKHMEDWTGGWNHMYEGFEKIISAIDKVRRDKA